MSDKYASKRPRPSRRCANAAGILKKRYPTANQARRAAIDRDDPRVIAYECDGCGFWHIGKKGAT
jgi:hypothetical protein